ncbi:MAG: ATP-binding protein [Ruminococcaceae bacterium]|nr:ATP-binding protein [Oscillospiraceae bacterium]
MSKKLVILMGIQGSGKSTFYFKYLSGDYVRVNLDTLKTRHQEKLLVEKCIRDGVSFAVDNTNPTKFDRERYIPLAKEAGYRIVGYLMECDIEKCIETNNARVGKERIPEVGIFATLKKLEIPSFEEGFDELYFVRNDGINMNIESLTDEHIYNFIEL